MFKRIGILVLAALLAACSQQDASPTYDDSMMTESHMDDATDDYDVGEEAGPDEVDDDALAEADPLPTPTPPGDAPSDAVRAVDQALAQLDLGHVAFNAPDRVNVADSVTVVLALSPDRAREEVAERITGPGEHVVQSVQVSNLMEARLTGEGFRIVAVTPARQAVGTGITEWAWDITPEAEGRRTLTLALDALIKVDGETVPRSLRTFRHPIDIEVTTGQRLGSWIREHGKWAWGALLLPLLGWWSKRRRADKPKSE
ncbi:hypothetical protein [Arenimonas donghaensis]|uniref:Uncharacterized protein n=1 Tax=Arenimonas donghaensis DSM 18148 = HO3-R19 TaxID=1121014 RepID=A0A087MKC1_9GAMM|nr:hypothetical protein [Arenimonas donghaensis]KFL37324.1 hypothetical protein N788_10010 [Arenimonas donghaensis DSM 18148 = HO3-R19]